MRSTTLVPIRHWLQLFFLFGFAQCIRLRQIRIPEQVQLSSSVNLVCDFKLEDRETLYSVKWYKNNMEFYRYINSSSQTNSNLLDKRDFTVFPQIGIYLDKKKSNTTVVHLKKSDLNTEGTYGCEVSTNTFSTVIAEKDLKIYVIPKRPLQLNFIKDEHKVQATCKSFPSKPPNLLYFLFNGELVKYPTLSLVKQSKLRTHRSADGLVSSEISITIPLNSLSRLSALINSPFYRNYYQLITREFLQSKHLFPMQKFEQQSNTDPIGSTETSNSMQRLSFKTNNWMHNWQTELQHKFFNKDGDTYSVAKASSDQLQMSCVSSIAQSIATTYAELTIEENGYFDNLNDNQASNTDSDDRTVLVQEEFSAPTIQANSHSLSPGQIFHANCSVASLQKSKVQPLLKWFINEREAQIDELILYNNKELYDDNLREFASLYSAYALVHKRNLVSKNDNQLDNKFNENEKGFDQTSLNSRQFLKQESRKQSSKKDYISMGFRVLLTKEHFQTVDGSIKIRCTCTYSTLIRQEMQTLQLQSNGKQNMFWFTSKAHNLSNKIWAVIFCASITVNFLILKLVIFLSF